MRTAEGHKNGGYPPSPSKIPNVSAYSHITNQITSSLPHASLSPHAPFIVPHTSHHATQCRPIRSALPLVTHIIGYNLAVSQSDIAFTSGFTTNFTAHAPMAKRSFSFRGF